MNKSIAASPHYEDYVFKTHNDTEVDKVRAILENKDIE